MRGLRNSWAPISGFVSPSRGEPRDLLLLRRELVARVDACACAPSRRWPSSSRRARSANASMPDRGEQLVGRRAAARARRRAGSRGAATRRRAGGARELRAQPGAPEPLDRLAVEAPRRPRPRSAARASAPRCRAPSRSRPAWVCSPSRSRASRRQLGAPAPTAASTSSAQRPDGDEQLRRVARSPRGRGQRLLVAAEAVEEHGARPARVLDRGALAAGRDLLDGGVDQLGGLGRPAWKGGEHERAVRRDPGARRLGDRVGLGDQEPRGQALPTRRSFSPLPRSGSRCLRAIEATIRTAGGRAPAVVAHWANAVRGIGLGHYEEALAAAIQASEDTPELFVACVALPELIEAATRSGDRARRAPRAARDQTRSSGTEWALGIQARVAPCSARVRPRSGCTARPSTTWDAPGFVRSSPAAGCSSGNGCAVKTGAWTRASDCGRHTSHLGPWAPTRFHEAPHSQWLDVTTGEKVRKRTCRDARRADLTGGADRAPGGRRRTNPEVGAQLFLSPRRSSGTCARCSPSWRSAPASVASALPDSGRAAVPV